MISIRNCFGNTGWFYWKGAYMIFVTGDMHADPGRFSMENFPEQKEMTRNDYMVICGDFGLLWDKEESKRENGGLTG